MYNDKTSIDRLLSDKLITSFTHHKLMALSLLTVGDIRAFGKEKLSAMPRIGFRVISDLEHVFQKIESQDPLLELKLCCSEGGLKKMSICYECLCKNVEVGRDFQAMFPSMIELLEAIIEKEGSLMLEVSDKPNVASSLYVFLFYLECLILDSHSEFYYYVQDNVKLFEKKVGSVAVGRILCSYLSEKNRLLMEHLYKRMAVRFKERHLGSMEDRVAYEVEHFSFWSYGGLAEMFKDELNFNSVHSSNSNAPHSMISILIEAYVAKDFEHTSIYTLGLFPFLSDAKISTVIEFHKKHGFYPMFYLFVDYLWSELIADRCILLLHSGIGIKRFSDEDLMASFQLSSFELRDILSKPLLKKDDPFLRDENWERYNFLYEMPFIGFSSPICAEILRKEQLHMDAIALLDLIKFRDVCLPESRQFFKCGSGNKTILLKACLFDAREIDKLLTLVKGLLDVERIKNECYQADWFLEYLDVTKLGGKEHFQVFFTYLMHVDFGIEVNSHGEFVLERNTISVTYELKKILLDHGKPMSVEDIKEEFLRRCPSYRKLSNGSIRYHLKTIEGIRPLGKSGLHGIDTWENVYWGTMIDKVYEVLNLAGGSLPLNDIYPKVKVFFPNTTKLSLKASMRLDAKHRFMYDKENHVYVLVEQDKEDIS